MKILELMRENYPVYIDINIVGNGQVDFNVSDLGWVSNPSVRLLPPYGHESDCTVEYLITKVMDYLRKIAVVPLDNMSTFESVAQEETDWIIDLINNELKDATQESHIQDFHFISNNGTVIDVHFGVRL